MTDSIEFTIETSRLVLRDFRERDAEDVHALRSDPEATRFMQFAPESPDKSRRWLSGAIHHNDLRPRTSYNLAITRQGEDTVIGWIGFGNSERHPGPEHFGVGYMLSHPYWGKGYATEALRAVIGFVFEKLCGTTVSAWCFADNLASARVMAKAGMSLERQYEDTDGLDGVTKACVEYRAYSTEWPKGS